MIRPMLRRGALAALLTLAPFFLVHAALGADDDEMPPPDKTAGVDLRDPAVITKGIEIISGTCGGYHITPKWLARAGQDDGYIERYQKVRTDSPKKGTTVVGRPLRRPQAVVPAPP